MNDNEYKGLTSDQITEMLPAFVVGALDPDEMVAVEEYIHEHPELMARVHELENAAAKLAYAAPPKALPQQLYGKVMNRARGQLTPRAQTPPANAPTPGQPKARPQRAIERVPSRPVARESAFAAWWRRRGLLDLAAVAAIAAAVILAALYRGALVDVGDLRRQVQGLEEQVAAVQAENVRLQSELDTQLNQMASITGAQHVVALSGTDAAPNASAQLYVRDTAATLVLSNLDPLGADQTYQLWLIPPDGAPIPAGLFDKTGEPNEVITLNLPTVIDTIAAIGVSIEPPGGSAAPTGPIVLLGERA
jgi:anti-sigma-K factor RskA